MSKKAVNCCMRDEGRAGGISKAHIIKKRSLHESAGLHVAAVTFFSIGEELLRWGAPTLTDEHSGSPSVPGLFECTECLAK